MHFRTDHFIGRNGGHLTAHAFRGFEWLETLWGTDEAIRGLAIERYTVDSVRSLLALHNKTDDADFVAWKRVTLLFTQEEYEDTRKDYDAALKAGVDLGDVEWLDKEEVLEVRPRNRI